MEEEKTEPQIGPIEEKLIDFAITPIEIGYLALFVFGFLSVSATTLVGECGNVEDVSDRHFRVGEIVEGSIVQVAIPIVVEGVSVQAGACAIVRDIKDNGTATVHVLAKSAPPFLTPETYEADHIFEYLALRPIQTLIFTLSNGPIDDGILLTSLQPIPVRNFSNVSRWFYLEIMFWVIMVIIVLNFIAYRIGVRQRLAREDWYAIHLRRMDYRVLLAKHITQRDSLYLRWTTMKKSLMDVEEILIGLSSKKNKTESKIGLIIAYVKKKLYDIRTVEDENITSPPIGQQEVADITYEETSGFTLATQEQVAIWKKAVLEADAILGETMQLIGEFEGVTLTEMLQNTTADDVPTLLEVWDAHRIAHFTRTQEIEYTPSQYNEAIEKYGDTLINFALLPYKPTVV